MSTFSRIIFENPFLSSDIESFCSPLCERVLSVVNPAGMLSVSESVLRVRRSDVSGNGFISDSLTVVSDTPALVATRRGVVFF